MPQQEITNRLNKRTLALIIIVTLTILISETLTALMINRSHSQREEFLEVLMMTVIISSLIYYFLVRPLHIEIKTRHNTEAELGRERNRLEQLTNSMGAGLAVINRDYQVIWTNRVMEDSFGSAIGANCFNAFKNCDSGPCDECGVREIFESGVSQAVSEHLLTDSRGRQCWFQVIVTPVIETDGTFDSALEVLVPIDGRKAIEEILAISQKRFQNIVESSSDWVWEVDSSGHYTYAGPQCRTLLGYQPEEIVGMTPFELMAKEEGDRVGFIFSEFSSRLQPFSLLENCMLHKSGRTVVMETSGTPYFDNDGNFCGYRGIDRDISERKELESLQTRYQHELEEKVLEQTTKLERLLAEQKQSYAELQSTENSLRQSELRFRQIFEQTRDAIVLFDQQSSAVFDANPAAEEMLQASKTRLMASYWADLHLLDESGEAMAMRTLSGNGEFLLTRADITTFNGRPLIVSVWGKQFELEGRKVLYLSLRDITERTRLEQEARQIQTKLIQTNKMTSLGFLVAGIAHEINNPNNNILLSTQLLAGIWQDIVPILERRYREEGDFILGGDVYSEVRESIPRIFTAITDGSRRIERIINNLRDFTVKSKSEMKHAVDVNGIVSISASILQHQIKKHTRNFSLELSHDNPMVTGNKQQLEQVIVNLIVNAIQSLSTPGLAVRVSTAYDAAEESVVISVTDQGSGIPPENLPYVFEPFFSTKLDSGGTGLGLAISSNIIKEHGGRLELASSLNSGTAATITLPALRDAHKEIQP